MDSLKENVYTDTIEETSSGATISTTAATTKLKSKVSPDPKSGLLESTLEVGFVHFLQWPNPLGGSELRLPFYGNIFIFTTPKVLACVPFSI